jgi:hypothetical protein
MGRGGAKRKAPADDDDTDIKDRYYTPKEYSRLTPGQRSKLQKLREGRSSDRQAATTLTELQRLTIAVAELKASQEGQGDREENDQAGSNRTNPALQRKKVRLA